MTNQIPLTKLLIAAVLSLAACAAICASETNTVYPTDDGHLLMGLPSSTMMLEKVAAARQNKECLPAENFPEGNWGRSNLGYQVSLRFTKPVFKSGDPITATVLVRNVTNRVLDHHDIHNPMGGPVHFSITTADGKEVPERPYQPGYVSGSSFSPQIAVGTQRKYDMKLNWGFDLPSGSYKVQAFILVRSFDGVKQADGKLVFPPTQEVKSVEVPLSIKRSFLIP